MTTPGLVERSRRVSAFWLQPAAGSWSPSRGAGVALGFHRETFIILALSLQEALGASDQLLSLLCGIGGGPGHKAFFYK